MIGPVQLVVIGFNGPEMPTEVRRQVHELRANPAVGLLGAQLFRNEQGQIKRLETGDVGPSSPRIKEISWIG
jgi:hypothetical protein